jgi:hypothetical protein
MTREAYGVFFCETGGLARRARGDQRTDDRIQVVNLSNGQMVMNGLNDESTNSLIL